MSSDNMNHYQAAGVNIDSGNELIERIKPATKKTLRPEVLGGLGGFSAMFKIPKGYTNPVLVTSTDGVGTKLKIAMELNQNTSIGIDLVAMCVNDLIVCGAEPLAFLDYYATGKLDVNTATEVIEGIAEGCLQAGCSLVGGETAEMPGMYQQGEYDLAGFTVGAVEEHKIISGNEIKAGDQLIGLASNGIHSNGYSLVRKIIKDAGFKFDSQIEGYNLSEELLKPTRIYVKPVLALLNKVTVKGMVHVTGGGFYDNIPRMLPAGKGARIQASQWQTPWIFNWLSSLSDISFEELYRTFNMGIGLIICIAPEQTEYALKELSALGEKPYLIGEVVDQKSTEDTTGELVTVHQ